jgi:hypothetical protein
MIAPVVILYDDSQHLLIAYSVVHLCQRHALGPKDNWMLMALASRLITFCEAHGAFHAAVALILLL